MGAATAKTAPPIERRMDGSSVTLDDKWTARSRPVLMNGSQAIARLLLEQAERDRARGLRTAGYVSGYRGSPLGNVDTALWSIRKRLDAAGIRFQPGVNEDLAATAVRGTQQLGLLPDPKFEGVFAAWYGKGPGVDRSCDALKHGNIGGASPSGGVLCFYGDDHAGKSSTVAHGSEAAMAACMIPSLYPADVGEIVAYGLLGYALSRWSGAWVGMKLVNETAEQTMTVDFALDDVAAVIPAEPAEGVHVRFGPFAPLADEQVAVERRLPLVHAFVRANGIDRAMFRAPEPRLGVVAAGKSYRDARQALALLGLSAEGAAAIGLSLYKVGCIWPLEPQGLAAFARGHGALLVVEEKRSFLEAQTAEILVNHDDRPRVFGKRDEAGRPLFSSVKLLEPADIALAIVRGLEALGAGSARLREAVEALSGPSPQPTTVVQPASPSNALLGTPQRSPYFCSGCPHNRSTRIPDGSLSMSGIGCHGMANFVRPAEALPPVHMGAEGANWLGIAPFSGTKHIFQNMGDGTYYHSGLLAIRAAVAAGVNITYKILYNDAVAMTGGQPVDGPISVAEIARQVQGEGVKTVVLVSDDPGRHRHAPGMPGTVGIFHRDRLDEVQRRLRGAPGTTVLIYEQTCAAEKRRRRKRGKHPDPAKRLFISQAVCEGCGDCSAQSTCVSLEPAETALGTKRRIDQASCNKDFSCVNGFCPSFITVRGAEPRKPAPAALDDGLFTGLPEPPVAEGTGGAESLMVAGIGGTGVVTAAALIAMAAHLDGKAASTFDMTGLAQKNGAVYSHVRVAPSAGEIGAQRIGRGEATTLIAFDAVAALGDEAVATFVPGRTRAVVNAAVATTVAFQFNRDFTVDPGLLLSRLERLVDRGAVTSVDATGVSGALLGDTVGATLVLLGVASQKGVLPVRPASLEGAVRLNGVAVPMNLRAFRLGRLLAHDPGRVALLVAASQAPPKPLPATLEALTAVLGEHLLAYGGARVASRHRALSERVAAAEQAVAPGSRAIATAVARTYARLLAPKDEYEVARLLSDPALAAELRRTFADGARLSFNLAPPILGGHKVNGRPAKREFPAKLLLPLLRLLARLRFLRGTPFDPFGRAAERRAERALLAEYEALVETVLAGLRLDNVQAAAVVLGLAGDVRGFGPVKAAAIEAYRMRLAERMAAFEAPRRAA